MLSINKWFDALLPKTSAKNELKHHKSKYMTGFETSDLYLATWLVMNGALIQSFRWKNRQVSKNKFARMLKIKLQRVDRESLHQWKQGIAYGDVKEFSKLRAKIKNRTLGKRIIA